METFSLLKAIAAICFAFILLRKICPISPHHHNKIKKKKELPEPEGAWPLIGHLHRLSRSQIPVCRALGAIADKHGPIFTIKLGRKRAIVVSCWEAVKDCFCTNDKAFLTRPTSAASRYMGYGNAIFGMSPYGPYWHHIRKIAHLELLSNRRLEMLKSVRASELETCIKDLYSFCSENIASTSAMVDMNLWFSTLALNMMSRMIAGKRYSSNDNDEESKRFVKTIKDFMYLGGVHLVSDVVPGIEWLDLQGHIRFMKHNGKELDYFMSSWLEEHLQNRERQGLLKEDRDLIDTMLSLFAHDDSIYGHKAETVIKATAANLVIGGADTTYLTLTWALSLLLNHVEALKAAQEELDIQVGKGRWVEESDIKNLVYLRAIVKETLRLYPSGPLVAPREAMEDCYVAGYQIPRGTRLLVNIWKLHRDPRVWIDPLEFKPERFISGDNARLDVRGHNFEYIPFSSGRRSCPGISSAMQIICLTLARVLQGFNLATPTNEPVDMSEGLGLTMPKATPLQVCLSLRLPNVLYQAP
ncbi:xanthotoxin 5-hydroxylase CYP82C4 [Ziziphus jujuba]|uniref:Xanthotoxin 5-hydroxylase CYP82C4 n=1 Tax=Ziziphus jujuba TaxID=326968 RepID=A0A6P4ABM7_ZIZJJ|nr:xanthotoxin 5-hydroxylase CYP82C4 [Ziziphus jujuba]